MKYSIALLSIILSLNGFAQQKELTWHKDVNKAINVSVQQEKPLLFFFTGSDWCGWCIRLQKAVYAKPEFKSWATKNVVLVELDFPRRTKLPVKLEKQNRELQQLFGVRGYPTIWFVTVQQEEGKINFNKLGTQGAAPLDVKGWIAAADKFLKNK